MFMFCSNIFSALPDVKPPLKEEEFLPTLEALKNKALFSTNSSPTGTNGKSAH
jgi:hypothetical protein